MAYSLATSYVGEALLSGFNWHNGTDLSNGFVSYQSRSDAEAQGLYSIDPSTNVVRLGVDSTNTYPISEGVGRPSIRLESKESYNHALFIADFLHMPPSQCGVWPAFWTYGTDWPNGGELDIIEGANTAHQNVISAHTSNGCFQDESEMFTGIRRNIECHVGNNNIGCGYNPPSQDTSSYGDSFNAANGGVYAMEWTDEYIKVWHFSRGQIPEDIETKTPQPEKWGLPQAVFGGKKCNVDDYFKDMSVVININFCGDYGNALWGKLDSCDKLAPTCAEYVAGNPEAFVSTYWDVKYIDAYTFDKNASSSHLTPTTPAPGVPRPAVTVGPNVTLPNSNSSSTSPPAIKLQQQPSINPATIDDYTSLGCYSPSSSFKHVSSSDSMTLQSCTRMCSSISASYAGVSAGKDCFCADDVIEGGLIAVEQDLCRMKCAGDEGEICGGVQKEEEEEEGQKEGEKAGTMTVYGMVAHKEAPVPPPMGPVPEDVIGEEGFLIDTSGCGCGERDNQVGGKVAAVDGGVMTGRNGSFVGGGAGLGRPSVVVTAGARGGETPSRLGVVVGVVVMALIMVV